MKTKITTLALGLLISPMTLAAMDCSDPMHAQMDACKVQAAMPKNTGKIDHSKMNHSKMAMPAMRMDHSKMDHSKMAMPAQKMDHSKMDHSKMVMPAIPVSDGAMDKDVPFPYEVHKMEDDPILTKFNLELLEVHDAEGSNPVTWEAEAWVGKDVNKLWFKTEGERVNGETEEFELQALYSRAIDPYWDLQVGLRKDFQPESREWVVAGFKGLAPYYFETDVALFVGDKGRTALRIQSEYELMLTQKLVLSPEIELNLYGKDDPELGIGSGLSDGSLGLRLRYEFTRQFAPYIGVEYTSKFGQTADFARDEGENISDTQLVLGIKAWF
ncbi:copper resistance protein B [Cocleimonas sp. KMM 6892]|uniref:copper resistance protein B n=1 Tax=unclassified Cocleimonas TaxID=2639732 RepID=UPI002DBF3805|nr:MULTISPECIES: copper resistance protein B [unclassified Cocleimonas]MEB8432748.1 copper resistance protein B [Cocleimonas sp. KMM 6892]MEC4715607.1 copper resistance protein B [Cocleimonas sp. KMM 6895]MEC4744775.1 copper resistance protein B [Cocleimonas sp. KMM 6896]